MSSHQSARPGTHVWLTPPFIIEALGGYESFDLDPCASSYRPWPTARDHLTVEDNGLEAEWWGRVLLNPPYEVPLIRRFMKRMADHNRGTALIFARTETQHFQEHVFPVCEAMFFIDGRLHFHHPDGRRAAANGGAGSVLLAYGEEDADILSRICLDGTFVPLRLRFRHLPLLEKRKVGSWADELLDVMREVGSASVADIYEAFRDSAKIAKNPNWRAKVRQHLQRGPYRNIARGEWEYAG